MAGCATYTQAVKNSINKAAVQVTGRMSSARILLLLAKRQHLEKDGNESEALKHGWQSGSKWE